MDGGDWVAGGGVPVSARRQTGEGVQKKASAEKSYAGCAEGSIGVVVTLRDFLMAMMTD
jgi:hypothetical protein